MNRTALVATLKTAAPALATKDLIPAFACFFFDGETVHAYDDVVAIRTPCEVPFRGGVPGKLLLDYLTVSRAKEIEFEVADDTVTLRAGRGRLALPLSPPEDSIFEEPDLEGHALKATDAVVEALRAANVGIGLDPSVPWRRGITVVLEAKAVTFFSSDNYTVTEATAPVKVPRSMQGTETIFPPKFVEQVVAKASLLRSFLVSSDWVVATLEGGTRIFSRALSDVQPEQFSTVLNHLPEEDYVPLPKGLEGCLDKALVVLGSADEQHTAMSVFKGRLRFSTEGTIASAKDNVIFPGHDDVSVRTRPSLLKRVLPFASSMRIVSSTELSCVALHGPGFRHMVSVL